MRVVGAPQGQVLQSAGTTSGAGMRHRHALSKAAQTPLSNVSLATLLSNGTIQCMSTSSRFAFDPMVFCDP